MHLSFSIYVKKNAKIIDLEMNGNLDREKAKNAHFWTAQNSV